MRLRYKLETGITIEPEIPGLIPRYYEYTAAKAAGYQIYGNWEALERYQRADIIALYFCETLIGANKDEVVSENIERQNRKRKPKG